MKVNIDKLYQQMTSKELACLAFAHAANQDTLSLDAVVASIPKKQYIMLDDQYQRYLEFLIIISYQWSVSFWKKATAFAMLCHRDDSIDETDKIAQQIKGIVYAMQHFCEDYGISFEAVCKFSGTHVPSEFLHTENIDQAAHDAMYGELQSMMQAGKFL